MCISAFGVVIVLGYLLGKLETAAERSQNRRWRGTLLDSKPGPQIPWSSTLGVCGGGGAVAGEMFNFYEPLGFLFLLRG